MSAFCDIHIYPILQGINEEAYDVNPDGAVTSADAVLVLKKLAGYDEVLGK